MTQNIKLIFFLSIILIGISIFYDGYRELGSISKFNPELITINKSKKNENLNLSENNKNIKKTKKIISSKIQNEENKYNKFNLVVSQSSLSYS